MACDASDCACRVADRISTISKANDRICVLRIEQCALGDLGSLCRGVRTDNAADFPFPYEPAWIQEKSRQPKGKTKP
jgi:hypothetical protein